MFSKGQCLSASFRVVYFVQYYIVSAVLNTVKDGKKKLSKAVNYKNVKLNSIKNGKLFNRPETD